MVPVKFLDCIVYFHVNRSRRCQNSFNLDIVLKNWYLYMIKDFHKYIGKVLFKMMGMTIRYLRL